MQYLGIYLLIINAVSFLLMWLDKGFSKKKRRRIPEKTLINSALLGGRIGAICGMKLFRHKTLHKKFSIGLPAILTLQIVIAVLLWIFFG